MTAKRDRPFGRFNFLVDLGTGETAGPDAGFQECSAIGTEVEIVEYRNGNDAENNVQKITGLNKATDVTMRRGVIGSASLYAWLDQVRDGDEAALRTVRITLQSEDHSTTVQTAVLKNARAVRYVTGPFDGRSSEVALEELTIAYERLELEDLT